MASCVNVTRQNQLVITNDSITDCTGFIIPDVVEYTDMPTLTSIFNMPIASDLVEIWLAGFSLPIIIYLSSWAFGSLLSFVNDKRH